MQRINKIIEKKKTIINRPSRLGKNTENRKENPLYPDALRFKEMFNISLPLAFTLVKKYGVNKLDDIASWWSDYPFKKKDNTPLLFWKLGQEKKNEKN